MQEEKTSEKYSKVSHHLTTALYKSAEPPLISLLFARKMKHVQTDVDIWYEHHLSFDVVWTFLGKLSFHSFK